MSSDDADESSVGDSSFEEEVPLKTLPPSPFSQGTNQPFSVVLKGGSPWGFKLKGGTEERAPLQISELEDGSKAQICEELRVGDYVLSVNDVRCTSHTEAIQLIQSAFRTLTLLIWRGTTEPLSSPVRSQSFLHANKARELQDRARQQAGIQDDSAVFKESKTSNNFRMKPRQRRIESFHGRRPSHQSTGSSQPGTVSTSNLQPRRLPSPHGELGPFTPPASEPSSKLGLKGWATEHDLTSARTPVIMSAGRSSAQGRHTPLSPAKSTPALNQDEPPQKTPRGYSPIQYTPMAMTKSTTDISDPNSNESVTSPTSPKSPSWYQQRFPSRSNIFDFSGAAVRRSAGSPRNSIAGYPSSLPQSVGGYQSQSLSPASGDISSGAYSQSLITPSPYSQSQTNQPSQPVHQQSSSSIGPMYSYDDTPSRSSGARKNYDRRSLPPQTLLQLRQDFQKENMQPESQRPLKSMPVTKEEDALDSEIPDIKPAPPDDLDTRPMYSPPAPPVRDISSLKYVGYSQNHEKYPSWPVSTGNIPPNLKETATNKSDQGQGDQMEVPASGRFQPQEGPAKASPGLERKSSDDGKQLRNQSDPGFKQPPKKSFYTTRKAREPLKDKDYENIKTVEERFEEFYNQSKPGYPPPKLDPDGHNYGDKNYSIPSPPERDMPGLDGKSLVEKIAAVISPSSGPASLQYQQYTMELGTAGTSQKIDSATSPLQSPSGARIPGMYFQQAMNAKNLLHPPVMSSGGKVDSGTSPLGSPSEEKNRPNFHTMSASASGYQRSESANEKSRGLIIRQMPYYNTSTQTDDMGQYVGQNQANRKSAEMSNVHVSEKSVQAQMSRSSVSSDSDSNARYSDNERSNRMQNQFSPDSRQNYPISTSTPRSETSTQNSSVMISDSSSAPLLRKLSEEFYKGKVPGSFSNEKRMSSASNVDELRSPRSEASSVAGLKEAGSYSSVVIHPHDNLMPFGRDDYGSHPMLTSSKQDLSRSDRETSDQQTTKPSHVPFNSSMFSHRPTASMSSMPPRSLQESRFTSETNLVSPYSTGRNYSGSMMQLPMSRSSYSDNQSRTYMYSSSGSSTSSHPRGSMEARSSGSRMSTDSSTSGISSAKSAHNYRKDSDKDSVFYDKSSPLLIEDQTSDVASNSQDEDMRKSVGVGRKESMKLAYGTYDEHERHYATPYGHQRNSSEILSASSPQSRDLSAGGMHGRSASFTDYMPMHGNNQGDRLGQIKEESSENQWLLSVQKAQNFSKEASDYMNVEISEGKVSIPTRNSDSSDKSDSNADGKASGSDNRTRMKRSSSEQIRPMKNDRRSQDSDSKGHKAGVTGEMSSGAESSGSKGTRSDSDSATGGKTMSQHISDSDLKKMQQKAVLDFVERKTKSNMDSSEPSSPVKEGHPELPSPDKPVISSSSILSSLTQKYNYTKAQRTESLRRQRSISSNSSRDSSDYVDMKRNYQTEWSKLRAITGETRRPLSIGSDASGLDNYAIAGLSPLSTPDGDQMHVRSISEISANRQQGPGNTDTSDPSQQSESAPPNSNVSMVTAPIYQNLGEYPRRPPPPLPKGGGPESPPALPPRGQKFLASKSESFLLSRLDPKQVQELRSQERGQGQDGSVMGSGSSQGQGQWENSPQEDSYADQLRRQARRFSEQQLKPMPMSIQSTKNPMHIVHSHSYKQEPQKAIEAMPVQKLSPTPSDHSMELSPPSSNRGAVSPMSRSPGPPPLPTPLKNGELEYKTELNDSLEFPPPPPGLMESDKEGVSSEEPGEESLRCADDSYGSYKNKTHRQVGQYKRAVSDSNVLRGLSDNKLRAFPEHNNSKDIEIPSKPPRRKLEQERGSPSSSRGSPVTQTMEQPSVSPIPPFQSVAEVSSIQTVTKSVAKPLQFSQRVNSPPPSGNIVSTVVQRPNQAPVVNNSVSAAVTEQPQERTSVRDRVKNIEVISHSPAGPKPFIPKNNATSPPSGMDNSKTNFDFIKKSKENETHQRKGEVQSNPQDRNGSSSLENLSNSVRSSNSFSDKLRPVVRKIEHPEQLLEHVPAAQTLTGYQVGESVPPIPQRTYKQLDENRHSSHRQPDLRQRAGSTDKADTASSYRRDSFQFKVSHPRPYENKTQNSPNVQSPVGPGKLPSQQGPLPEVSKGHGQAVPEPQVPSRSRSEGGAPKRHRSGEQVVPQPSRPEQGHNRVQESPNSSFQCYSSENKVSNAVQSRSESGNMPNTYRDKYSPEQNGPSSHSHARRDTKAQQPEMFISTKPEVRRDSGGLELRNDNTRESRVDHSNKRDIRGEYAHRPHDGRADHSHQQEQREDNVHNSDRHFGSPGHSQNTVSPGQQRHHGYHSSDPKNWRSPPAGQNQSSHNDKINTPPSQFNTSDQKHSTREQSLNSKNEERDTNKSGSKNVALKLPHSGIVISHGRQPSQEELECNEKAQELASVLPDSDKALSEVLRTDSNKSRMQYMNGLFQVEANTVAPARPRSASRKDNSALPEKKEEAEEEEKQQHSPMPSNYYMSSSKAMIELEIRKIGDTSEITKDIGDNEALINKKEELLQSMMRKVETLKDDKRELLTDIEENENICKRLLKVVDEKCKSQQEKDKFRSYVEDLEKIIRLLLKLSGLLARAENAIQSLTEGTNEKIKKMTYDKRDRLHQQHEEAKELKADIDRRSEQVLTSVTQVMTPAELEDYHYYIKMKSNYTIQMQEIEDKITLGMEQISALQKSIPSRKK